MKGLRLTKEDRWLALLGFVLLSFSMYVSIDTWRFEQRASFVSGTVNRIQSRTVDCSKKNQGYSPCTVFFLIIEFQIPGFKPHQFYRHVGEKSGDNVAVEDARLKYRVGDIISIAYDPQNPSRWYPQFTEGETTIWASSILSWFIVAAVFVVYGLRRVAASRSLGHEGKG